MCESFNKNTSNQNAQYFSFVKLSAFELGRIGSVDKQMC